MAKVTEYSRITRMKDNDILLVDGPDGTRTILQTDAAKQMGGEVIMVGESAGGSTTVVVNTTGEDVGLATTDDLDQVVEDVDDLESVVNIVEHTIPRNTVSGDKLIITDAVPGTDITSLGIDIKFLQSGSGDPSPSNVRAITGWSSANVKRCGKNMLPNITRAVNAANVMIGQTASYTAGWETHLGAGTYVVSVTATKSVYLKCINKSGTFSRNSQASTKPSITFTVQDNDDFAFWVNNSGGVVPSDVVSFQLEQGSVPTEHEAYSEETFAAAFPVAAGTVYGGVLDLTAGTLTVDCAFLSLSGNETWGINGSGNSAYFYTEIGELREVLDRTGICSHFTPEVIDANTTMVGQRIINATSLNAAELFIRPNDVASLTVQSFKSWLAEQANANTPVQVVYKLTTPIVYTLTPVQITAVEGNNTFWADCGTLVIEYVQNTRAAIEAGDVATRAMIGEASGNTASRSLAVGEYVNVGDKLYKVTSAIAAGETLTPGSNVTVTTVGAELTALFNLINA